MRAAQWWQATLSIMLLLPSATLGAALGSASSQALLPVEKAFAMRMELHDEQRISVQLLPAPGYYLYRDRISFLVEPPLSLSSDPQLPPARSVEDRFMGHTEIYEGLVSVHLEVSGLKQLGQWLELKVSAQGCSSRPAVCYPPFERHLRVLNPFATTSANTPHNGEIAPVVAIAPVPRREVAEPSTVVRAVAVREGQQIAQLRGMAPELAERLMRGGGSAYGVLPLFFWLGLLLAFTPCVLPMLPVVAAMVVGAPVTRGHSRRKKRGLGLVFVYVLSLASAWALAGLFAGALGGTLQRMLQQPLSLVSTATLFLLLGMSMIGLIEIGQLRAPRLDGDAERAPLAGPGGAMVMGVLAALVLSPCISPALVGALLYLAQGGSALWGGGALFAMGLGMGFPLLLLAAGGGRFLPRPGAWLTTVRHCIGFLLLAVGLWLLARVFSASALWATVGALLLAITAWWGGAPSTVSGVTWLRRVAMVPLIALSIAFFARAATGEWPLFSASHVVVPDEQLAAQSEQDAWVEIVDSSALQQALSSSQQPTVLLVRADWCAVCLHMERSTFRDDAVHALLSNGQRLVLDVTDSTEAKSLLLENFQLFGPPALLFFDANGQEQPLARRVGYVSAEELVALAEPLFRATSVSVDEVESSQ